MSKRKKAEEKTAPKGGEPNAVAMLDRLVELGVCSKKTRRERLPDTKTGKPKVAVPRARSVKESMTAKSEKRRIRNRKLAEQNRRHYLREAKKGKNPWHKCVKSQDQYSEFILIDLKMAQLLLDEYNPDNRRVRDRVVQSYTRDLDKGLWIDTEESIGIDEDGLLYNGQHRLLALVASGKPQVFYVTFNCLPEARYAVDQAAKRDVTDKIGQVLENKIGKKLPAIARAMIRGCGQVHQDPSHLEIMEFSAMYGDIIEWAFKALRGYRKETQAALAKAALWHGIDKVQPFADQLNNVMFNSRNDPAKRLYERCMRKKTKQGLTEYKLAVSAITHFLNDREIANLREKETDFFEWESDWMIPKD